MTSEIEVFDVSVVKDPIDPLSGFANSPEEQEWAGPPAFEDVGEGLAHLDETEKVALAELETEARERMAQDEGDPRTHNYFMRLDKKTVVKNDKEYVSCQLHGVSMKIIPYSYALQLLKEEDARKVKARKIKKAKKTAKASRKRNHR